MSTTTARLLVCEKSGEWAAALRRSAAELAASHVVGETRSLAECREALEAAPASMIVFEISLANLEMVLSWMVELDRFPLARAIVVGGREIGPYEWLLREAGALHVALAKRSLRPVATLALRHLAAYPPEPTGIVERIFANLPWSAT
jgi:hypothetical protein